MNDPEFSALVERVRNGDEAAAAELVRLYEPEIRRFIRFRLTSPRVRRFVDSFDICQSVLGRFFHYLSDDELDLSEPGKVRAVLMTMTKHRLLDVVAREHAARRDARRVNPGGDQSLAALAEEGETPSAILQVEEIVAAIYENLDPDVRTLVQARMNGSDWNELAQMAASSPEAVRKQVNRAIQKAAEALKLIGS